MICRSWSFFPSFLFSFRNFTVVANCRIMHTFAIKAWFSFTTVSARVVWFQTQKHFFSHLKSYFLASKFKMALRWSDQWASWQNIHLTGTFFSGKFEYKWERGWYEPGCKDEPVYDKSKNCTILTILNLVWDGTDNDIQCWQTSNMRPRHHKFFVITWHLYLIHWNLYQSVHVCRYNDLFVCMSIV